MTSPIGLQGRWEPSRVTSKFNVPAFSPQYKHEMLFEDNYSLRSLLIGDDTLKRARPSVRICKGHRSSTSFQSLGLQEAMRHLTWHPKIYWSCIQPTVIKTLRSCPYTRYSLWRLLTIGDAILNGLNPLVCCTWPVLLDYRAIWQPSKVLSKYHPAFSSQYKLEMLFADNSSLWGLLKGEDHRNGQDLQSGFVKVIGLDVFTVYWTIKADETP